PHVQRGTNPLINLQHLSPDRGADDIHHCIHCPNLVEMDPLNWYIMDLRFCTAKIFEDRDCRLLCQIGNPACSTDDLANLFQPPSMFVLVSPSLIVLVL